MQFLGVDAVVDCIFAIAAETVNAAPYNCPAPNFFGTSFQKLGI